MRGGEPPVGGCALLGDAGCCVGQEGCQVICDGAACLDERSQDGVKALAGRLVAVAFGAGQLPWSDVVDVAVSFIDDAPQRRGGPAEVEAGQGCVNQAWRLAGRLFQFLRSGGGRSGGGNVPVAVAPDHRHSAVDEVAEPVGEFVVSTAGEPAGSEVCVCTRGTSRSSHQRTASVPY